MSLADTAELAVDLTFESNAPSVIGGATKDLDALKASTERLKDSTAKLHRGFLTLGAGIGTAIRNGAKLAIGAVTSFVGLIALSVKEGQEALKVERLFADSIRVANAGTLKGAGKVNAADYRALIAQQTALLELTGKDDELIASIQTKLIGMRASGQQALALTPLIVAASTASGLSVGQIGMAVGKAIQGSTASLSKLGIIIPTLTAAQKKAIAESKTMTDEQKKAALGGSAYSKVLTELTRKYGGVNAALSGDLNTRLSVFNEKLAGVREKAGIQLRPSLTRVVDIMGRKVVPAFADLVDRYMPTLIGYVDEFATALENGGAERAIKGITDALGPLVEFLKISAGTAKTLFDVFMKLPGPIQGLLVGGFAINKLSGGLIGAAIPDIVGGLLGSRGSSPANPMYVSDVAGGLGGAAGKLPGVAGAVGNAGAMLTGGAVLAGAALSAGAVIAVGAVALDQYGKISDQSNALAVQAAEFVKVASLDELKSGRQALIDGAKALADESRYNPLAAASFEGMTKALGVLDRAIATFGLPALPGPFAPTGEAADKKGGALFGLSLSSAGVLGVMNRAISTGMKPTQTGIIATLKRNAVVQATIDRGKAVAKAREAANAVAQGISNTDRIVGAILGINIPSPYTGIPGRQGENDVNPAPIRPGGSKLNLRDPRAGSSSVTLNVNATATARDITTATGKRTAYNGTTRAIGRSG